MVMDPGVVLQHSEVADQVLGLLQLLLRARSDSAVRRCGALKAHSDQTAFRARSPVREGIIKCASAKLLSAS